MRARQDGGSTLLFLVILFAGALLYVWIYHPGLLKAGPSKPPAAAVPAAAPAPVPAESAQQREARWAAFYKPHASCAKATELAKLECMSDREAQRTRFEAQARAPQAQAQRPK